MSDMHQAVKSLTLLYVADARSPHTQRLVNFFAERGHRVHLFDFDRAGETPNLNKVILHRPNLHVTGVNLFSGTLAALRRVIDQVKPDILHGHYVTHWGWLGACAGFRPYVLTAWGSDIFVHPQQSALNRRFNRFSLRRASLITADSQDLLKAASALRGVSPNNEVDITNDLQLIPFGIDFDTYHEGYDTSELKKLLRITDEKVVLSPRQFKPNSNIKTLIHAIPEVLKEVPATIFLLKTYLTASSPYETEIRNLVDELGIGDNIRFISDVPSEQMPALYNLADIMVTLTSTDGSACSMLEAMACKTPVIASDIPSTKEWIQDGANGRLVDPHNTCQVKTALVSLLKDPEARKTMADAAYDVVNKSGDCRTWWTHLESLYIEHLNNEQQKNSKRAANDFGPKSALPKSPLLKTVWTYLDNGQLDKAAEVFGKVSSPEEIYVEDLSEVLFGLANCALKSHKEKDAAKFCQDAFMLLENCELEQTVTLGAENIHNPEVQLTLKTPACRDVLPLVSILMCAWNAERFIRQAIESILNQSYKNFELIIVDDGSTDQTKEIVTSFSDSRIKYAYKKHSGLADSRNYARSKSIGDYTVIIDADDIAKPAMLETEVRVFLENPEKDIVVYTNFELIDAQGKKGGTIWQYRDYSKHEIIPALFCAGKNVVPEPAMMIPRHLSEKTGTYNTQLRDSDNEFIARLARYTSQFICLKEPLYFYRRYDGNMSSGSMLERANSSLAMLEKMVEIFNVPEIFPDITWQLDERKLVSLFHLRIAEVFWSHCNHYSKGDGFEIFLEKTVSHLNESLASDPSNVNAISLVNSMLTKVPSFRLPPE